MSQTSTVEERVADADVSLNRDVFLRDLIRELSGMLEETVGLDNAAGYVSVVGGRIGRLIDDEYRRALGREKLSREEVAATLVDLKRRIDGDFYIIEVTEDRIVLGNRACPFGDRVQGRPSLCMMTSNVFGSIAADNLGYSKVELQETIAEGAAGCRVVVHLQPDEDSATSPGREYFASDNPE